MMVKECNQFDSIKIYAYDLVNEKEEIKCNNIIKGCKSD